jgi:hypothetical protein
VDFPRHHGHCTRAVLSGEKAGQFQHVGYLFESTDDVNHLLFDLLKIQSYPHTIHQNNALIDQVLVGDFGICELAQWY